MFFLHEFHDVQHLLMLDRVFGDVVLVHMLPRIVNASLLGAHVDFGGEGLGQLLDASVRVPRGQL